MCGLSTGVLTDMEKAEHVTVHLVIWYKLTKLYTTYCQSYNAQQIYKAMNTSITLAYM